MSFSKARIQRFNEFENNIPPPGAYDPKFDVKVKGSVIEKSERFHDNKSVLSEECSLSVSTRSTGNAVTPFRTPQLQRKKSTARPTLKVKPCALTSKDKSKLKYESEQQLADLKVECSNKDETIKEQERYIDHMMEEVQKLQLQIDELRKKQTEMDEKHGENMETMVKLHQEVLNEHEDKYETEKTHLQSQLLEVSKEKEREFQTREIVEEDLRNRISDFSKRVTALETEIIDRKRIGEEKILTLKTQIEELIIEQEMLKENHKLQVDLLEKEKSELSLCINNITNERDQLELKLQEKQNLILELQAQLSVIQCELNNLKAEYDKVVKDCAKQVNDLIYKHQKEIDKLKIDFEKEREILLNETKLEKCCRMDIETKVKEIEKENNSLEEKLEDVQRLYKDVNNRLTETQKEVEDKARSLKELESIKSEFETKIEDMKQVSSKEIMKLQAICNAKDAKNTEMIKQLHEMATTLNKTQDMLLKLEERNDTREREISRVKVLNSELDKQLKENTVAMEETNKLLKVQSANHTVALNEANSKIEELSSQIKQLEENDNPTQLETELFEEERSQWKTFEKMITEELAAERSRRDLAEEEIKKLLELNDRLRKDYEEISEKYAEVVGHQNHRQRIKHVSQLKDKINQLEQDLYIKTRTIEQQQKMINKLKSGEKRMHNRGNENILGIPKDALTTSMSTPHTPLTPLRSRND